MAAAGEELARWSRAGSVKETEDTVEAGARADSHEQQVPQTLCTN